MWYIGFWGNGTINLRRSTFFLGYFTNMKILSHTKVFKSIMFPLWRLYIRQTKRWNKLIPEISSLLLHSDDKRYHWTVQFESSIASLERGWTLIIDPKVSEPPNSYKLNLFSSALLLSASWKKGTICQSTLGTHSLSLSLSLSHTHTILDYNLICMEME